MNCDICARRLTEDNTYEKVLCRGCMDDEEKLYCCKCKCIIKFHKQFLAATSFLKKINRVFIFLGGIFLLFGLISIFSPHTGLKLFLGLFGIVSAVLALIIAILLLFPGAADIGNWLLNKVLKLNLREDNDLTVFVCWLTGLLVLTSPVSFYYAGTFVLYLFHK